jgi:peptide chain release factor 1
MKILESDFRIEWFSGTGKGGQHRNKHQNCCRVIHEPTGIKAQGTGSRSREDNKRNALAVCRARIVSALTPETERYRVADERVRTYHAVDNRVIDHASGRTDSYKNVVVGRSIEKMVEARKLAMGASH